MSRYFISSGFLGFVLGTVMGTYFLSCSIVQTIHFHKSFLVVLKGGLSWKELVRSVRGKGGDFMS